LSPFGLVAAGHGAFNVTSYPVKELRLVPLLRAGDGMTHSLLREVKSLRSLRDMLPLGDGYKDAKLIQSHAPLL
jgi:hypothetical protein